MPILQSLIYARTPLIVLSCFLDPEPLNLIAMSPDGRPTTRNNPTDSARYGNDPESGNATESVGSAWPGWWKCHQSVVAGQFWGRLKALSWACVLDNGSWQKGKLKDLLRYITRLDINKWHSPRRAPCCGSLVTRCVYFRCYRKECFLGSKMPCPGGITS